MPWIDADEVEHILQTDLSNDQYIDGLILQAQALAENEIGVQDGLEPPGEGVSPSGLQVVLAQIVARMWRAGRGAQANPAALSQETTGPFGFQDQHAGAAGLGLTNREIKALRKAAGLLPLGVISTTRGDLETPAVTGRGDDWVHTAPASGDVFGDGSGWAIGSDQPT